MKTQYKAIIISVLVFSLFFSGCSSGQLFGATITPLPTSTNAPSATATATAAPTETATPTGTPLPVWSPEYTAKRTETKEITVRDLLPDTKGEYSHTRLFNLDLVTDETFYCESGTGGKYEFVGYNAFSTSKGEAGYHSNEAYQAVAKVIMWAFFESAVHAGYEPEQVLSAENKYDAFAQFVHEMTEGKQVEIQAILPVATQEFKLQTETLRLPETMRVIFVDATNYKFKSLPRNDESNWAWGMHIAPEDKLLELFIGGDKNLYYAHAYNLSNQYAFSTWQAFGLNGKQALFDLASKGNQFVANGGLTGALDCKR